MILEKKDLLEKSYADFMKEGLTQHNLSLLNQCVDVHAMGFGTTKDEKLISLNDLCELLVKQKEQSQGLDVSWEIKPLHRYINSTETMAVYADELFLYINFENERVEMYMRFSMVFEFKNENWFVVHWHGSKPEQVHQEKETSAVEKLKQKAAELEQKLEEQSLELMQKTKELELLKAEKK